MYQKTYIIKRQFFCVSSQILLYLSILFILTFCNHIELNLSLKSKYNQPNGIVLLYHFEKGWDCHWKNYQMFLKICLQREFNPNRNGCKKERMALLDSGASQNFSNELTEPEWIPLIIPNQKYKPPYKPTLQYYLPWKDFPKGYSWLLGQPFFESHCLVLEGGEPLEIFPYMGKPCFLHLEQKKPPSLYPVSLEKINGIYSLQVDSPEGEFLIGLDTGSGFSSLPKPFLSHENPIHLKEKFLYPDGSWKQAMLFKTIKKLAIIHKNPKMPPLEYQPEWAVDIVDACPKCLPPSPILGMDFFKKFRVYLDIPSKIMYLEEFYEKRKNYCRNERGS